MRDKLDGSESGKRWGQKIQNALTSPDKAAGASQGFGSNPGSTTSKLNSHASVVNKIKSVASDLKLNKK